MFLEFRGSKLKRILTLMITKAKTLEINNIHLKKYFEHICFKYTFDLENYEF
jgi:hypothetical protein